MLIGVWLEMTCYMLRDILKNRYDLMVQSEMMSQLINYKHQSMICHIIQSQSWSEDFEHVTYLFHICGILINISEKMCLLPLAFYIQMADLWPLSLTYILICQGKWVQQMVGYVKQKPTKKPCMYFQIQWTWQWKQSRRLKDTKSIIYLTKKHLRHF